MRQRSFITITTIFVSVIFILKIKFFHDSFINQQEKQLQEIISIYEDRKYSIADWSKKHESQIQKLENKLNELYNVPFDKIEHSILSIVLHINAIDQLIEDYKVISTNLHERISDTGSNTINNKYMIEKDNSNSSFDTPIADAVPIKFTKELSEIHVSLTEGNRIKQEMVKNWLNSFYSGYPDLVKVLLNSVKCPKTGCKVKGPMLPLDVIEFWCRQSRGNPSKIIMNHTSSEVRYAYIMTWYERNGHETRELTLIDILSGK